ncbi:MAG TPA: flagellar hook capping FlgD N-terminal domain-containing protein [Pirellulales bacterium]|nr:flagellar hook capping FlgD N-terminal domain-containing protein [Pirellulales bacterium]
MSTGSVGGTSGSSGTNSSSSSTSALTAITPDDFLQMLITQLQDQDPMNPTDSDEILQQVSEIDNIESTTNLSNSLTAVATDQGFQAASGLIGMQVQGIDASGNAVSGVVDSASFANGTATLNVGSQSMPLSGVSAIGAASSTTTDGTGS